MQRVSQAEGATPDGRFYAGDPLSGIPATQVSEDWLNAVQSEIANVIESRGIALDPKDEGQLYKAILDIYAYGLKPLKFSIENGVDVPTDLSIDPFDQSKLHAVVFNALSVRHTTKADMTFAAQHVAVFNSYTQKWVLLTQFDPVLLEINGKQQLGAGPHFLSISASGKLQYETSKLEGDQHQGSLTLSHFRYIKAA